MVCAASGGPVLIAKSLQNLVACLPHVPGTESHDDIAGLGVFDNASYRVLDSAGVFRPAVAEGFHPIDERFRCDSGDVLLGRSVDVENEDGVGSVKRAREVVHKVERSGVSMRLEDGEDASELALT